MNLEDLLTEDEAAARMKICGRTLRKERKAGRVHYVLLGRCVRYHPDDIAQLIASKRVVDVPQPTRRTGHGDRKVSANHRGGVIVPFSQRQRGRK
jgi:hypothetical protein